MPYDVIRHSKRQVKRPRARTSRRQIPPPDCAACAALVGVVPC
jgi:hypothetical protein